MKKIFLILGIVLVCVASAEAKEPQRGYRGFFDWDNSIGTTDYFDNSTGEGGRKTMWYFGLLNTTHGYQFNNHVFVGAGFLISLSEYLEGMVPVYLDFRYDCSFGKFTPYADLRGGMNFSDGPSLYLSPTVGYRFNWGRRANLNVGLGLTLRGIRDDVPVHTTEYIKKDPTHYNSVDVVHYKVHHQIDPLLTIRIGIDF